MKISTKGRYALRLMIDLAQNYDNGYITIKSISERQEISVKYLEQIINVLSRAGFVKSTRGPQGGYRLANRREYTAGMILRQIEGASSRWPAWKTSRTNVPAATNARRWSCGSSSMRRSAA